MREREKTKVKEMKSETARKKSDRKRKRDSFDFVSTFQVIE